MGFLVVFLFEKRTSKCVMCDLHDRGRFFMDRDIYFFRRLFWK